MFLLGLGLNSYFMYSQQRSVFLIVDECNTRMRNTRLVHTEPLPSTVQILFGYERYTCSFRAMFRRYRGESAPFAPSPKFGGFIFWMLLRRNKESLSCASWRLIVQNLGCAHQEAILQVFKYLLAVAA